MNKKTLHKKWYFRLLKVIFFGSLMIILGGLAIISISEDDIPLAGFVWAGIVMIIYWLIKKIFYYILFREKILSLK